MGEIRIYFRTQKDSSQSPPHSHLLTVTSSQSPPHSHLLTVTSSQSPLHSHLLTVTSSQSPPRSHLLTVTWPFRRIGCCIRQGIHQRGGQNGKIWRKVPVVTAELEKRSVLHALLWTQAMSTLPPATPGLDGRTSSNDGTEKHSLFLCMEILLRLGR